MLDISHTLWSKPSLWRLILWRLSVLLNSTRRTGIDIRYKAAQGNHWIVLSWLFICQDANIHSCDRAFKTSRSKKQYYLNLGPTAWQNLQCFPLTVLFLYHVLECVAILFSIVSGIFPRSVDRVIFNRVEKLLKSFVCRSSRQRRFFYVPELTKTSLVTNAITLFSIFTRATQIILIYFE